MDISKIRVEYRSYVSATVNLLRRPLQSIKINEIYANLRDDLGVNYDLAKRFEVELRGEMQKNTHALAPREFSKEFE